MAAPFGGHDAARPGAGGASSTVQGTQQCCTPTDHSWIDRRLEMTTNSPQEPGPTGRENGAQGRGRRPTPWEERTTSLVRPERPRELCWRFDSAQSVRDKSTITSLSFSRTGAYPIPRLQLSARISSRRSCLPGCTRDGPFREGAERARIRISHPAGCVAIERFRWRRSAS